MAGQGTSLSVEAVSVGYGRLTVLHDVGLAVGPGEFVALLGPSGCGKTTLLRAVAGFVPVARGRIRVGDADVTAMPPDRRGTAMVFQSYALWPHMTAGQNVGYGLKLRGVPRAERRRRVEAVLTLLGLEGYADRPVTQMSGGQRQRVALGRALAVEPPVLLLDEPLSNLDARIRQTVRHEIKALQQQLGITTVHVTHDREEAMIMADRIALLEGGRIAQLGTPEEVYNRPASPFVASFLGAENVLEIRASPGSGASLRVEPGDGVDAAELPVGEGGAHAPAGTAGRLVAHFRSEAARLLAGPEAAERALVLRGRIAQVTYPGGFWRYAVEVGRHRFMVDDPRRLAEGEPVRVALPAAALHLFPAAGSA